MSRSYRGGTAKLYQEAAWDDTEDIVATPSWTEWTRAIDVTFTGSKGEAIVSSRESSWVLRTSGLKDASLSVTYRLRQLADTIWDGIVTEWLNDTPILIAVMSTTIATSGAKGWQMPVEVFQLDENQPNEDGAEGNLTLNPTDARDASGDLISPSRLVTA